MSTENPEAPASPEPAREGPQLPWEGKARRVDLLCWGGITLSGIYALALLPLVPSLIGTNPVLLELLRGSTTAMSSSTSVESQKSRASTSSGCNGNTRGGLPSSAG